MNNVSELEITLEDLQLLLKALYHYNTFCLEKNFADIATLYLKLSALRTSLDNVGTK